MHVYVVRGSSHGQRFTWTILDVNLVVYLHWPHHHASTDNRVLRTENVNEGRGMWAKLYTGEVFLVAESLELLTMCFV